MVIIHAGDVRLDSASSHDLGIDVGVVCNVAEVKYTQRPPKPYSDFAQPYVAIRQLMNFAVFMHIALSNAGPSQSGSFSRFQSGQNTSSCLPLNLTT